MYQFRTYINVLNYKKALDNKEYCGLLLTDLSKAFGCVKHDLLTAKMNAYNFDNNDLALVYSYTSDRKQRTNINSSFSPWHDIIIWVPTWSILGPLLFNIYINDIFYTIKNVEISNFADDHSPFIFNKFITEVLKLLEEESNKLYRWYELNWLKPNAGKYHLLLSSHDMNLELTIITDKVRNSSEEKLLGVTFDNGFPCKNYMLYI